MVFYANLTCSIGDSCKFPYKLRQFHIYNNNRCLEDFTDTYEDFEKNILDVYS